MTDLKPLLEELESMHEDTSVPKNVRAKLKEIKEMLEESDDLNMAINKALDQLDRLAEDSNLQSYTRTQLYNISSMLELY